MRALPLLAFLFVAAAVPVQASAAVNAQVSARETYVGMPITMHIELQGASADSMPEPPTVDGVDIQAMGAPSRSSQITIINGRRTENTSVTYAYRLTPRRAGTFDIPPFTVKTKNGTEQTAPLRLSATTSETGDLMFAEVAGQRDSIFVGEPLDVTLKIWLKPFADQELGITLSADQMWQMVSQETTQWGGFQKTIDAMASERRSPRGVEVLRKDGEGVDRRYHLYEIDATIYPKAAGTLDATDIQIVASYPTQLGKSRDPFEGMMSGSMFGIDPFFQSAMSPFRRSLSVTGARPVVAQPDVFDVKVEALPTLGKPADFRGAVGNYAIATQATPNNVAAGDPVTLHIGIRGTGPMDLVQSPPLSSIGTLAEGFKVSDEPLAGVVEGDTKVFMTTIRPRNEDVTRVPSIPFSFFDPATKTYRTVHSDPISVDVRPAEKLALTSIVGKAGSPSDKTNPASPMSKLALDNYTGNSVLKIQAEPSWSSALAWMLTLPAIILMAVYGIRRAKRLLNSEKLMPARRINDAATPTNVADYVRNQLTAKFDEKVVAEIYSRNCTAIPGDLHQRIRSLADDCDQATFAGYDTPIEELKSRAVEIVCELKRVSLNNNVSEDTDNLSFAKSRTASMKSNRPVLLIPRVWPACRIVFTAACLCGAIALWGGVAEPVAETTTGEVAPKLTLTDWQREQLLVEATEAYKIARAEKDAVESRIAYENATQKYQMLIDSGIENSKLYFNVANSLLQSGEFDRAISYYERAKRLNPVSISIRKNLNFATKFSAKSSEQLG